MPAIVGSHVYFARPDALKGTLVETIKASIKINYWKLIVLILTTQLPIILTVLFI